MQSTIYERLSYPTHFLKTGVLLLEIVFFHTEVNKTNLLRNEMIFISCSLQIKQSMYAIGIFGAPVLTQFIVKV